MKIEHMAIWVGNLESMRCFYEKYFGAVSNSKYENPAKGFQSYFLTFDGGGRLELMQRSDITQQPDRLPERLGLCHFAIAVGMERDVDELTRRLGADGYEIASHPRRTGDGYYESVVLDPEGNRIEITAG